MALLALTLSLLSLPVATVATQVLSLAMSPMSFDDQYRGCGPAMATALPALTRSEFQNNPLFARVWPQAEAEWRSRGSPVSPLSPNQAIAILAYTTDDLYKEFNDKVRTAGRSRQEYRDNFHFKTLHFLLSTALATLRDKQEGHKCHQVFRGVDNVRFVTNVSDVVRFGQFASSSLREDVTRRFGTVTVFRVRTCHGGDIREFSRYSHEEEVLIPPFEVFKVTNVTEGGDSVRIDLESVGTYSKYNCEWVTGGSVPTATVHLGWLLLATTALAVTTGIL